LLLGNETGRRAKDEVTLFKSLGIAVEDLACARFLHEVAERDGVGTRVDMGYTVPT
jgi:ornithine cyclodeaminase